MTKQKTDKHISSLPSEGGGARPAPQAGGGAVLAAIDIGSNAARLVIKQFDESLPEPERVKKLMFVRVPLRLGKDVFTLGKVSRERQEMMVHMLKGYRQFMKLWHVEAWRACATSAMRDAENGRKVLKRIKRETGIRLEIVKGSDEALLLANNLVEKTGSNDGNFAYVDVGGGSTEISLIHNGELAGSRSYNIGTLRLLADQVPPEAWRGMEADLRGYAERFEDIRIIGSGGNINKLYKISESPANSKTITADELQHLYKLLAPMSIEERKETFGLKDDRADVIVPAARIFIDVARQLQCKEILVPNISLADSIVDGLYKKLTATRQPSAGLSQARVAAP